MIEKNTVISVAVAACCCCLLLAFACCTSCHVLWSTERKRRKIYTTVANRQPELTDQRVLLLFDDQIPYTIASTAI